MQGQTEASLYGAKETILYFCATYNFAAGWAGGLNRPSNFEHTGQQNYSNSLGLYTLGRIFEQSITELEILEAEADGRPSVNKESKRKRDGVYYTPEWIVERIIDETLSPRLDEIKKECGWQADALPDKTAIDAFTKRLKLFTVVDPACGSGAFLITSLRYLLDVWHSVTELRKSITGEVLIEDEPGLVRGILKSNIYGVDINSASVEIAQLALWLHTARGDKPLSALGETIREGNSLINNDFYKGQIDLGFYDDTERERVNAFDWHQAFPEVFARGGFDAVVGNPPYVKLQNFRKAHADMADFLRFGRPEVEIPGYKSTQSGNFDLYLPFIEKGLSLLNERGRLGFIAPSLWTVNQYGAPLRSMIETGGNLERWLDFRAHQIFEEAIVYTALQFFTLQRNTTVKVAFAPDGIVADDPWAIAANELAYNKLDYGDRWLLIPGVERQFIEKITSECTPLDDPANTQSIFQGVKTGADSVFKLQRLGSNYYKCTPDRDEGEPYEVTIEDEIMFPILSGPEAKRYISPITDIFLLFPYVSGAAGTELRSAQEIEKRFPNAWRYLQTWRNKLIKRDNGELDDEQWYRFSRSQSLDRFGQQKLVAAGTVPSLRFSLDEIGRTFLTGGRADGIIAADTTDPWFLLGVLNAPVADYVFKRVGRIKQGNFYEANKQFIAPLPIPAATPEQRANISGHARTLQASHSSRRDVVERISRRMQTLRSQLKPDTWLFPDLRAKRDFQKDAPSTLDTNGRKEWALKKYDEAIDNLHDGIGQRLHPGVSLEAHLDQGELSFSLDGVRVISRIFETEQNAKFILAQWKVLASTLPVTTNTTGERLSNALRRLILNDGSPAIEQIMQLQAELSTVEAHIAEEELQLNSIIYDLYDLNSADISALSR
jgi:hypothetical protein